MGDDDEPSGTMDSDVPVRILVDDLGICFVIGSHTFFFALRRDGRTFLSHDRCKLSFPPRLEMRNHSCKDAEKDYKPHANGQEPFVNLPERVRLLGVQDLEGFHQFWRGDTSFRNGCESLVKYRRVHAVVRFSFHFHRCLFPPGIQRMEVRKTCFCNF